MQEKPTLVLGASLKPHRYSNLAIRRLREHGHPVLAVGLREGRVGDVEVVRAIPPGSAVHTATLYLNPANQAAWAETLLALRPERIVFNPGAENPALVRAAEAIGIECLEACTLVMLASGTY